jgi:PAS domain S-box-containing protein
MNNSQIILSSNSLEAALTDNTLIKELDSILDFVTDICKISDAFISVKMEQKDMILSKKGLKNLNIPEEINYFNEFVSKQEILILPNANQVCNYQLKGSDESLTFFAGFPIRPSIKLISGSLCVLKKKEQEISETELKIIEQCISQIESILNLSLKNADLQIQLNENRQTFESFIENSNEIIYELSLEGTINYVSNKFAQSLGYTAHEIIGTRIVAIIHPEDVEKCFTFISSIKLDERKNEELTYRIMHEKGHYVWHSSKINLTEKNNVQCFTSICRDITAYFESKEELKRQKEFYETILDRLPTDVAVFDPNHKYIYLNPIAIKNKALREYIIGKDDFEYAKYTNRTDAFAIERRAKFTKAIENRETLSWEEQLFNSLGEESFHERKMTPVFNDLGELEIMIGFSVDITERTRINNERLKNRQFITSVIENLAVGILVQGPESEIIENNKAACEMLGLTQDQLLGKTSFDVDWQVIHEDGLAFTPEEHPVPQAIKYLKPINNVVMGVYRPETNDLIWLLVDTIPIFGDTKELLYVICSFNDITIQKNIEEELRISNERFTYVNMATSDVIWDWKVESGNFIVSKNYTKLFGYKLNPKNNILKVDAFDALIHPDDLQRIHKNRQKALESKAHTWNNEFRYLKLDGTYANLRDKAYIIRDESNNAIRAIGALTDITLKEKLRAALVKSEEKFKSAFEHSSLGIAFVSKDGYYLNVNNQFSTILGYSEKTLKTLHFSEITHPDDLKEEKVNVATLVSKEKHFFQVEKRYMKKDNTIIWTNMFTSVVWTSNGEIAYFIAKIIDITAVKLIEEQNKVLLEENNRNRNIQLNNARNLYRLLADNTIDLVCLHDLHMAFEYVSPSIKALTGYTPECLIGKTPMDFAHPKDIKGMIDDVYNFTSRNQTTPIEYRYLTSNGKYIWLQTIAKIVYENGAPLKIQTSTRDISIRKKADFAIEKTLERERELNQLRTNLVSTISHEFRTPMTTIRTSAELIEIYIDGENSKNEQHLRKQINRITDEIDRIIELMNAVLIISKDDSGKTNFKPIAFDLRDLCISIIETNFSSNTKGQEINLHLEGDAFFIFADKNLIEYSIFNLLHNAFKYSENCQNIEMTIKSTTSKIHVEIVDFGIGIPKKDQPNLFNTFFRASNTDGIQGTGLGLYIVKTFLERNFGKIKLESQLGKGTRVMLELPKAETTI